MYTAKITSGNQGNQGNQMRSPEQSTAHQNLQTLCLIRLIPLGGLSLASLYLFLFGQITLPWAPVALLLSLFAILIGFSWWRSGKENAISDREFFAQLIADVILFGLLLYFTGGASNPFVSYFLVPITIAAITLPRHFTLMTGALCLAAYSALLFWFVKVPDLAPIQAHHHSVSAELNMHIIGMWANFFASALLIIWFVTRMAEAVRVRDEALMRQRALATEQHLQDEQLLAVATLAASAAHDLGTPLNTIKLIVDDWRDAAGTEAGNVARDGELEVLSTQVDRCQYTMRKLTDTARAFSRQDVLATTARQYFDDLIDRWMLMRPDVKAYFASDDACAERSVHFHPSLAASIHNILNNAGDASPQRVDIRMDTGTDRVRLTIRDHGEGIAPARLAANNLGDSGKATGLGLGLFLSRSILARHGATLEMAAHPQGGTVAVIELPLAQALAAQTIEGGGL
jgi:two-component system, sensor histidine kinase RegB